MCILYQHETTQTTQNEILLSTFFSLLCVCIVFNEILAALVNVNIWKREREKRNIRFSFYKYITFFSPSFFKGFSFCFINTPSLYTIFASPFSLITILLLPLSLFPAIFSCYFFSSIRWLSMNMSFGEQTRCQCFFFSLRIDFFSVTNNLREESSH